MTAAASSSAVHEIVNIDSIEADKENVARLKSGRSAAQLSSLLSQDRKTVEAQLKEGHQQFKDEIASVESGDSVEDDQLDVYHRYVRWTLSSYPSGPSHASHLVPLLELTTRRFVKDQRYKSDLRYLRLWILYAKYVDTPRDIYRFLEANQIGVTAASFYEEWASVEEANNKFKEADAVFNLGVARRAEPLNRLKKRRDAFQARMILLPQPSSADNSDSVDTPPASRSGLGSSTSRHHQPLSASSSAKPNGALFAVFTDSGVDENGNREAGWEDLGTRDSRRRENHREATAWRGESSASSTSGPGSAFGGEKLQVFRDEDAAPAPTISNNRADQPFVVKSIRAPSEAESLRANPFKNYNQDIEAMISFEIPNPPALKSKSSSSALRKAATSSTAAKSASTTESSSKPKAVLQPTAGTSASANKKERVASPLGEVYPEDELGQNEYSFEEILAQRRGLRSRDGTLQQARYGMSTLPEWLQHASTSSEPFQVDSHGDAILYRPNGEGAFAYIRARQEAERVAKQQAEQARRKAEEAKEAEEQRRVQAEKARLAAEAARRAEEAETIRRTREKDAMVDIHASPVPQSQQSRKPPSPTINTKAALAEVNDMFGSTMRFDDSFGGSETDFEDEAIAEDHSREEIPASQASQPGDFMNDSFWGAAQSQASQFSQPSQPRKRSPLLDEDDSETEDITIDKENASSQRKKAARPAPSSHRAKRAVTSPEESETESDSEPVQAAARSRPQPNKIQVFQDSENSNEPRRKSGYSLGRKPFGGNSRFAPLIDTMDAITERTLEYTGSTAAPHLKSSHGPLPEEDEDEEAAEEFEAAFVATADNDSEEPASTLPSEVLAQIEETHLPKHSTIPHLEALSLQDQARNSLANRSPAPIVLPEGLSIDGSDTQMPTDVQVIDSPDLLRSSAAPLPPCIPYSESVVTRMLQIEDAFSTLYHNQSKQVSDRFHDIQKHAKPKARRSATSSDEGYFLQLGPDLLSIRSKLGEGGFGAVFRVANTSACEGDEDELRPAFLALKVQRPASLWEFFNLSQLRSRLSASPRTLQSIIVPYQLFHFSDESFMLLEVCDQGTLLDAVNQASTSGTGAGGGAAGLDEGLAMFFAIELLRILCDIHRAGFIHGDFKIDNCLVRLDDVEGGTRAWSPQYKRDGSSGWSAKGIKIIDYGRTIDTTAFPSGQTFLADFEPDGKDCREIREKRPWTYQPDYHGLAGIIFTMLFGKHFDSECTVETTSGLQLSGKPFRRYHQVELWTRVFSVLLDPCAVNGQLPITEELDGIRGELESWLEQNADKAGRNLKSMLKKVEIAHLSR